MKEKLTLQEKRFCKILVSQEKPRQGQAAREAGYSSDNADSTASKLMKKDKILRYIEKLEDERNARLDITPDYVMKKHKDIVEFDLRDVMDFDISGQIALRDPATWPERAGIGIVSIEEDRIIRESPDGTQTIVHDKIKIKKVHPDKSLENMGRGLGLYHDKISDETERPPTEIKVIFATPEDVTPS